MCILSLEKIYGKKRLYKANVNKLFAQLGPDRLRYFERSDVSAFIMTIKKLFVCRI